MTRFSRVEDLRVSIFMHLFPMIFQRPACLHLPPRLTTDDRRYQPLLPRAAGRSPLRPVLASFVMDVFAGTGIG